MTERHMLDLVHHQNPVTLTPERSVKEACESMKSMRVGAILVVEEKNQLIGIFTGRDAVCRVGAEGRDPAMTTLEEVMTREPVTMETGCTAIEALRLMQDCGFRHIPITEEGRLIGVVSKGDFRGLEQARLDEETQLWERI